MSPSHPPRTSPRWVLVILAALGLASLTIFFRYRTSAFPEHAIHFAVQREEATDRAAAFVRGSLGIPVDGYSVATAWRVDDQARTYLEKTFGLEQATDFGRRTDLWHFTTRFFRPLQLEEFQVSIAPEGHLVGYRHIAPESAPGARLDGNQARALAEQFRRSLADQPGDWVLVGSSSTDRPARLDWQFSWERRDLPLVPPGAPDAEPGHLHLDILLQGDQLGELRSYVQVPEAWRRAYQGTRSASTLAQSIATVGGVLPLGIAALVIFVRRFAAHALRWRRAAVLGALAAVLLVAGVLNAWPTAMATYTSSLGWEAFVGFLVAGAILGGLFQGLVTLVFAAAGDALARERLAQHPLAARGLGWPGSPPGATRALAVGVLVATVMAAYQVGYYALGARLGLWTPAEIRYDNLYGALAPWLAPTLVGYTAASFEESAFRLFAIPFLAGLLARAVGHGRAALWLAVVLSAVVWGFLHSTYPQDPFFARGLELVLPGVIFGWLFLRFGILAPLAAHYTFDALLYANALDGAGSLATSALAYAGAALPLLLAAGVGRRLYRAPTKAAPESAGREVAVPAQVAGHNGLAAGAGLAVARPYRPLGTRRRVGVLALGLLGLAALGALVQAQPPSHPFRFAREGAAVRADTALAGAGVDAHGARQVVTVETPDDSLARAYLREHGGPQAERAVFGPFVPTAVWQVRSFRPLERDEYRVQVLPDAEADQPPFAITYDLAETTPGARLDADQARRVAEDALRARPDWQGADPVLVDQGDVSRPDRLDHRFVFERRDARYGDATLRAELQVVGDRVSGYRPFVQVPEDWRRARTEITLPGLLGILGLLLAALGLLGLGSVVLLRLARTRALDRTSAFAVAGLFLGLGVLEQANSLPLLYQLYPTATPEGTYLAGQVAGRGALLGLGALVAGVAWALLLALWRARVGPPLPPPEQRRAWAFDAALLGLALPLVLLALAHLEAVLSPIERGPRAVEAPAGAATLVPALAALTGARGAFLGVVLLMASVLVLWRALDRLRWVLVAWLALPLMLVGVAHAPQEALAVAGLGVGTVLLGAAVARFLLRDNLAAYLLGALVLALGSPALTLLQAADGWLLANGVLLGLAALLAPVGLLVVLRRPAAAIAGERRVSAAPAPPPAGPRVVRPTPPAAPGAQALIQMDGLTRIYGERVAVSDLSLAVSAGEVLGFLGPNGAGKSTTMRLLAGLLKPTRGTARVAGYDVARDPVEAKRRLGYMAERAFLHPKLTGREFLAFMGDLYRVQPRTAAERAERLLALLELDDHANELVEGYSQGMRQKLALAGVLLHEPLVLLLDEPTSGLDPRSARLVRDLLAGLARQGRAVFLSTHVLGVAEQLCHRVAIIDRGHLVAVGTVDELRRQARSGEASLEDIFLRLTGGPDEAGLVAFLEGG